MSSVAALMWSHGAQALDSALLSPTPISDQTDAVSAFNGQWVLELGWSDPAGALFRATGSFTVPIQQYGLQTDLTLTSTQSGVVGSGTLHVFARDPSSWMVGITKGVVISSDATLFALGAEGELYLNRVSLEGWGGFAYANYADPGLSDQVGLFAFGDVAFYPTDDLRLVAGASTVLGVNQVHFGSEFLLREWNMPVSLVADARVGSNSSTFTVGLHGYFGGDDDNKTLILRHREDNLRLRSLDLYGAAGDIPFRVSAPPRFVDPEESQGNCEAMGGYWYGSFCDVTDVPEDACEWLITNIPLYEDNNFYWDDGLSECLYGGGN